MSDDDVLFEDDPVLGSYIDNYPSDRLRLLLQGGFVLGVVWFIVTVLLWQVEAGIASIITVIVIGIATLLISWYLSHLWNREVVIYERGFSYREGSVTGFFRYEDIISIRQQGQILSYFGGLVRRSTLRFTIVTDQDELITLTNLYRKLDKLTLRLESEIIKAIQPRLKTKLIAGKKVAFTETLYINKKGLSEGGRDLSWDDFGGYKIQNGQLKVFSGSGEDWYTMSVGEVDNLRVLVSLFKEYGA